MWLRARARGLQYSMIVVLFVHPAVSGMAMYYFRCHSIMDNVKDPTVPNYYMVADYSLKCYDEEWYSLLPLAIFQVVGFAIGMPALFYFLLWRNREEIQRVARQDIADELAGKNKKEAAEGGLMRRVVTRARASSDRSAAMRVHRSLQFQEPI